MTSQQRARPPRLLNLWRWGVLLWVMLILEVPNAAAANTLQLGILALRPKPLMVTSYQPLVDYLNTQLGEKRIALRVLTRDEIDAALAREELDLLLTNPGHYLVIRSRHRLTGALATLANLKLDRATPTLAGVIIASAQLSTPATLEDLADQRIAVPGLHDLDGYQAQAYELLQAGLRLPDAAQLVELGSHDAVVQAVLAGQVGVGFIRSGIIESMASEGILDPKRLRIIHPQSSPDFPFLRSTQQYPEWPLLALPRIEPQLLGCILNALLALEPHHPAAQAAHIAGFAPPADYFALHELAHALELPPFASPQSEWPLPDPDTLQATGLLLLLLLILTGAAWLTQYHRTRLANERFNRLFTQLPTPILILENDRFIDCNPAVLNLLGYQEKSALIGLRPEDLCSTCQPNGEPATIMAQRKLRRQTLERAPFVWTHRRADGSDLVVEVTLMPFILNKREVILVTWHDITAHQRAEINLRHERELFSAGPVVILHWAPEPNWPVLQVSSNVQTIFGFTPEEMTQPGFRYAELIHPDDLQRVEREVNDYLDRHVSRFEQSYRLRNARGVYAWYYDFTQLLRDDQGHLTSIRGYLFDQSRIKELEFKLDAERQSLLNILWGTGAGTWEWDLHNGAIRCNERWAEMIGYRLADLGPFNARHWFSYFHPEDRERAEALRNQHFAGELDYYACEIRLRHRDGRWLWVQDRGKVVSRASDGSPLWMAGTQVDISERKHAEQALTLQREHLARSNAELEQFAYIVSHDLRQPLRMIHSYIQILERRLSNHLDEETRMMMGFVTAGALRMDQMLVSLLDYSRVGRKGDPLALLPSREAVEEALRFLVPTIAESRAEIHIDDHPWPLVWASRDELTRLFQNLIGNAIKYREPDRPAVVNLQAQPHPEGWQFSISDQGIGIEPEQFNRLFKMFQRLHTRESYEGTGIGLAICRKIIEHHGGRIWVESAGAHQGSTFHLVLPAPPPSALPQEQT